MRSEAEQEVIGGTEEQGREPIADAYESYWDHFDADQCDTVVEPAGSEMAGSEIVPHASVDVTGGEAYESLVD